MYLKADNLYKKWPDKTVGCSLSAERGTVTAIVGASGAGKSTILRLIAGLERNDRADGLDPARILLDGKDITDLPPEKRGCGMVFQAPSLFLHMDVADNVAYGLVCRGMRRREARERASEALRGMSLEGMESRFPETLSGGEAQRVQLLRTLIINPALVLLDEPLSALDAPLRKRLASEMRRTLTGRKQTALLVTHDIAEAQCMADRILLLSGGKIVWQGAAQDFDSSLLYV